MSRTTPLLLLALGACVGPPPPTPTTDASVESDGPLVLDARTGRPDGWAWRPYTECDAHEDCEGGTTCAFLPFARGLCTTGCDRTTPCPGSAACVGGLCWPGCGLGASTCRNDAMCVPTPTPGTEFCAPACDASGDEPEAACPPSTVCTARGDCVRSAWTGRPNGASCAADDDCASRVCLPLAGLCVGTTRQPPDSAYLDASAPFPQGRCADGTVVMPAYGAFGAIVGATGEGSRTTCMPACTVDADCASGLRCERRGLADAPEHATGGCIPDICDATVPGSPCGEGLAGTCEMIDGDLGLCRVPR